MIGVLAGARRGAAVRTRWIFVPACGLSAWLVFGSPSAAAVVPGGFAAGADQPGVGPLGDAPPGTAREGTLERGHLLGPTGPTGFATSYADGYSCGYPPGSPCELAAFSGVSCASLNRCTAVGSALEGTTLAEGWDGTNWTIEPTPAVSGSTASTLLSVSCPATNSCLAVGYEYGSGVNYEDVPLAESWDGSSWTVRGPPTPSDSSEATFHYVQCAAVGACMAVGSYYSTTTSEYMPLVESWDGTSWTIQTTATLPTGSGGGELYGVSCPSTTACTVVGDYQSPSGESTYERQTLAESWNGMSWSIQSTPNPTGTAGTTLNAVWCESASSCTAVGTNSATSGGDLTVAESWNGTAWAIQPTPNPTGATVNSLANLSCAPAGTPCKAVGSSDSETLVESWDGTSWTLQPSAQLDAGSFSDVSCTSATACTAVGQYLNSDDGGSGAYLALVERWDGTAWTVQPAQDPPQPVAGDATNVTSASATLNGEVNPNGANVTDCHFEYGPTFPLTYTAPCAQSVGAGRSPVAVSADVSGLTPDTTYFFALDATNAGGDVSTMDFFGSSPSFTTSAAPSGGGSGGSGGGGGGGGNGSGGGGAAQGAQRQRSRPRRSTPPGAFPAVRTAPGCPRAPCG